MLSQSCTHGPAVFTGTEADALRIVFMTGHADSAAYGGLFRTCRAGRDWVLTTAPHAHLTLQLADEQLTGDRWQRQLQATQGALVTRGQVQTDAHITTGHTISLEVPYSQYSAHIPLRDPDTYSTAVQTAGNSLISFIQQAGQYVSTLRVEQLNRAPAFVPTFLQRAATGLVSLTSLVLVECPCVLPLPSQLPHLTHFSYSPPDQDTSRDAMYTHTHVNGPPCKIARHTTTTTQQEKPAPTTTQHHPPPAHSTTTTSQHQELDVSWEEGVFRNSIARMLPQLTRFCFESGDVRDTGVLVDILRSCTGPFLRLTELFTPPLDDNLLGVVLDMCTSVRRLEVASVLVASAQYRGRQWGVQELAVCSLFEEPYDEYDYDAHTAVMCALALLPGASHGALAVGSGVAGVRARHRLRVVRPGLPCVLETETDSLLLVAHDKKVSDTHARAHKHTCA